MERPQELKRCSKCGEKKPEGDFSPRGDNPKRLRSHCDECRRAAGRDYVRHNAEAHRARHREWRAANPEKELAQQQRAYVKQQQDPERRQRKLDTNSRSRARKEGIPIIELVDRQAIIERDNSTCYLWCGRRLSPEEVTLDHVVPIKRGGVHVASNLRVACQPCNSRKSDRLLEELRPELDDHTIKRCSNCGELKNIEHDFYYSAGLPMSRCKECQKARQRHRLCG